MFVLVVGVVLRLVSRVLCAFGGVSSFRFGCKFLVLSEGQIPVWRWLYKGSYNGSFSSMCFHGLSLYSIVTDPFFHIFSFGNSNSIFKIHPVCSYIGTHGSQILLTVLGGTDF